MSAKGSFASRIRGWACAGGILFAPHMVMAVPATGEEADKFSFMGVEVKRHVQDYVVTTDINIRAKPTTKSKKLGILKERQRVQAIGQAPGAWVAIRVNGKDSGFVYKPALLGVLDGKLKDRISGTVKKAGHPDCRYAIDYQGKSEAQGQVFEIADYEIHWHCRDEQNVGEFTTLMFMTEGPYAGPKNPSHQITVDIVNSGGELDEIVSTTVFYNREKSTISFDGVSDIRFSGKPDVPEVFARSLPEALRAGVEMSYQAWPQPLWKVLLSPKP